MISTIIIAFFSLIVLIILHELGHFLLAKKFGVKVEEFGIGYPPRLFGKKFGETIYSLNLLPFGAFVKIYGEEGEVEDYHSFTGKPIWQRVLIVLAGVIAFWIIATLLFMIVFALGVEVPVSDEANHNLINPKVQITAVTHGSPADNAKLRIADIISELKFESEKIAINKVIQVQEFTQTYKGQEIILTIQRGEEVLDISLIPRPSSPSNEGLMGVGLIRTATIIKRHSWYEVPIQGIFYCGEITGRVVSGLIKILGDIFRGKGVPPEVELVGSLGIVVFLAQAIEIGLGFFLYFIGVIAVLVAIFNLFPIPALDGGKLLFLAIEKIRAKPVSPKIEQKITTFFFILLVVLAIFVTIKFDIPRLSEFIKS